MIRNNEVAITKNGRNAMSFLTKQNIKHLAFIVALVVCFAAPALADVGQASTQDLAELNRELTAKISALERQIFRQVRLPKIQVRKFFFESIHLFVSQRWHCAIFFGA